MQEINQSESTTPVTPAETAGSSPKKKNRNVLFIVLLLLLLLLGLIAALILLLSNRNDDDGSDSDRDDAISEEVEDDDDSTSDAEDVEEEEVVVMPYALSIEQVGTQSILNRIDLETLTVDALYTAEPEHRIDVSAFGASMAGFSECNIPELSSVLCTLSTLDITTGEREIIESFSVGQSVHTNGWYDANNYAYVISEPVDDIDSEFELILSQDGTERTLISTLDYIAGRGGAISDDVEIKFSPDGEYMYYIATILPGDIGGFRIFVFNTSNYSQNIIDDATHPVWYSDTEILYRDEEVNTLSLFNVETGTSSVFADIAEDMYFPDLLLGDSKIALNENNYDILPSIWIYNTDTETLEEQVSGGSLPKWVDANRFLYINVSECDLEECFGGYVYSNLSIFDTVTMESTLVVEGDNQFIVE